MYKVNISIDDITPHPLSSIKVIDRCYELLNIFPEIKFTLFVPTAYWRVMDSRYNTPYFLHNYTRFCEELKNLNKNNFEIGYHGHFHSSKSNKSNNDEFRYSTYNEAKKTISKMFFEVDKSGMTGYFKPIIRPPAWRMTKEAIKAAADSGIKYFCLSKDEYAIKTYKNADKDVITIYQTCNPPFHPLNISTHTEIVYHACEWDKNFLNNSMKNDLISFLRKYKDEINFCFTKDMI